MADVKMPHSVPCRFEISWKGPCAKPSTNGWCSKHEKLTCCSCGKKATRDCDQASSLVCGAPLCETCAHSLNGDTHVTEEVFKEQVRQMEQDRIAVEQSRSCPDQRMDREGDPTNLFELLKRDTGEQGYHLEKVYSLRLETRLMAYLPAVIDSEKRVVICRDKNLLVEIWRTLEPRQSQMDTLTSWVNTQKGIAYVDLDDKSEQERSKPMKLLTREEYGTIPRSGQGSISWAPGLLGGKYFSRDEFMKFIDDQVGHLRPK